MIIGLWHVGSGMGDQTFAYLAARVRALDLGVDFGMIGDFKGSSFMDIDKGKEVNLKHHIEPSTGAIVIDEPHKLFRVNTPYFNPEFNFIQDGTIIDGYGAQDERYWGHRLDEIREWLKVKDGLESFVAINFRGGEYASVPDLFLQKEYWAKGIEIMKEKLINPIFYVHTDDRPLALEFFKEFRNPKNNWPGIEEGELPIMTDIEHNWRTIRYAKNAIISNSAFAIIPRILKHLEDPEAITIAPRYWAGRYVSEWRRPQNYYRQFQYI